MAATERLLELPKPGNHYVQFYEGDESILVQNVARYFSDGFAQGETAIAITTPAHSAMIAQALSARGVRTEEAIASGRFIVLDAGQTLARILLDGHPNAARFDTVVGCAIREATAASPSAVRAYGEMVGLLWQQHQYPAAIRLEQLWHNLLKSTDFSLFCSYPIDIFSPAFEPALIDALLCAHTHLLSSGVNDEIEDSVRAAVSEVLGSDIIAGSTLTPERQRADMPRGEGMVLWVRQNWPDRAAEVLSRAREYYCAARAI